MVHVKITNYLVHSTVDFHSSVAEDSSLLECYAEIISVFITLLSCNDKINQLITVIAATL